MNKQQVLTRIALLFQSDFRNYVLNPTEVNASKLTASQKRTLDGLISNPSNYSLSDLQNFIDGSVSNYTQKYNNARDALDSYTPPPPEPVSSTVVGAGAQPGQVPVGSAPVRTDIEPGELSRPAQTTGARDVEPGEMSRPGMGGVPGVISSEEGIPGLGRFATTTPYEELRPGVRAPTPPGEDGVRTGPTGPAAVTDVAETPADANIPEDWRNAAAEAYPNYYAIVRNIPEVAALLERAVAQSFTPEQFQAQLEQTAWWQQTTASAREFEINGQRDPATQQTLIDNKRVEIRDLALSSFGVRLSDKRLDQLAVDSIRYGWSARFLQNAIGDVATQSTAGVSQLREGYIGQQLRKTANDYGIAVSDATFNQWVNKVAVGEESTASWQDYARVQAKNLFPSIADRIDAGETFQNIVDPYRESAARLLEIDGGEIDFTQPDWIKAITYQDDKGQQRPMSFTEWNDYVRQNRSFGYEFTEQAQQRAYQVANRLADLFGKV